MANGYIGKISALVTASTADLSRKLQGSTSDIKKFSGSINAQFAAASRNAQASLNAIFTPLQRIERTLFAGRGLNLITEDQANKLRQAVSAAELINKPLAEAQRAFTGLSAEVSAGFLPALVRAQDQALLLNRRIQETGQASAKSFAIVEQSVQRTAAAVQRLAEAQNLLRSGPRGQELAFVAPEVSDTLRASAASRQQASELPAASRRAAAAQVANLANVESRIAQVQARIERARLRPRVDATELDELQQKLAGYIAAAERIRQSIQVRIDTERASKNLEELKAQLEQTLTGRPANFDQVAAEYQRLRGEVEKLEVAQRQAFAAGLGELVTLIAKDDVANLERARTLIEQIAAGLEGIKPAAPDRLSAASERLRERAERERQAADDREAELELQAGRRTDLGGLLAEQGRRRVQGLLGDINIDSTPPAGGGFSGQAQRDIDALGTRVGAVRQQLETLPNALRVEFIPALQQARAQLVALQNAPAATVEQIQEAAFAVERLERNARGAASALNFRQSLGGAGTAGIESVLSERALSGYGAQLNILQQALGRVSAEARGPALQSFARLRDTIADAMARGTLETAGTREQIRRLTQEAVAATAAVSGVRQGALERQVRRAGDIGRAGFGNASLALNQLVFAVDDFFSVTGGAEQRIRALGNNITQFGFIVGGTAGLVAGLAAVLVAQGLVAFIRYSNGGATAEDQTKALNDALQKQRALVDDLASAFENLSRSLTEGLFSEARAELEQFREEVRRLVEQQRQARDAAVASTSPRASGERAIQERFNREIQAETNLARRQALERQRRESLDIERRLNERIRNAPAPSGRGLQEIVQQRIGFLENLNARSGGRPSPQLNLIREAAGQLPDGQSTADRQQQLAQLEAILNVLKPIAAQTFLGFRTLAARAVENTVNILEQQAALVERELARGVDADAVQSLGTVRTTAIQLAKNVESLEEAVSANVLGAAGALSRAEDIGAALQAARDRLVRAQRGEGVDGGPLEGAARAAAIRAGREEVERIEDIVRQRQGEFNAIASVNRSLETFGSALNRVSKSLVDAVSGDARGAADEARRGANRLQGLADGNLGLQRDADFAQRQRLRQDQAAANIEARAAGIQEQERQLQLRFQQAAGAGGLGAEAQNLIRRRDAAQAVLDNRQSPAAGRIAAEGVVAEASRNLQQLFESLPEVQRLAGLADALDAAAQGAIEFGNAVQQGRNLVLTDAQRVADDFIAQVQQINAALAAGEINQGQRRDAIERLRQEGLRQLAPNIFGLADQVANAVAQGPSRAALQAADVSTVEGSRELNRLLRGEDSARDQPLIELQREANRIAERIARGVENNEAQIANN